jgi:hypothetical protein
MPTAWLPCPGKMNARIVCSCRHAEVRRRPSRLALLAPQDDGGASNHGRASKD